jgi:transposase
MMLKSAMTLKSAKDGVHPQIRRRSCLGLEKWADRLRGQPRGQPDEEFVRKRLLKQQDHLFTFLRHDAVEATNNLAERQLRPAVIARKLSCGNRTAKGAGTWEVMASLAATCRQRGASLGDSPQTAHPPPAPLQERSSGGAGAGIRIGLGRSGSA